MNNIVYILYSDRLGRFYAGYTGNIENRLKRHNEGKERYTKKGTPWKLIKTINCASRSETLNLEKKIKKRGIRRYLEAPN